ncbi:MAG: HaeIII family restriction endonuclease [Firmicutes bacterium]|nr:HaeIII family restriction endonuclease [Bacillota bacterium]
MPSANNSTKKGKAYEYACVLAVQEIVSPIRAIEIVDNSSLRIARQRWGEIIQSEQSEMLRSAAAGIKTIIKMEPKIIEDGNDKLTVFLQPDNVAKLGDVRDMLIIRRSIQWEIGVSVKHNHSALKHSRLSTKLDFGNVWLGVKCAQGYFDEIKPIFDTLTAEKAKGTKWSELTAKDDTVYVPILNAFKKELLRLNTAENQVTQGLVKYLIGSSGKDYYKLIHRKNFTTVMPFNLYGSLNTSATNTDPEIDIPAIELPTRMIDFSFKDHSKNTLILTMNNGWSISFRIHNASTIVEPSLKFDIQLQSKPENMFYMDVKW